MADDPSLLLLSPDQRKKVRNALNAWIAALSTNEPMTDMQQMTALNVVLSTLTPLETKAFYRLIGMK